MCSSVESKLYNGNQWHPPPLPLKYLLKNYILISSINRAFEDAWEMHTNFTALLPLMPPWNIKLCVTLLWLEMKTWWELAGTIVVKCAGFCKFVFVVHVRQQQNLKNCGQQCRYSFPLALLQYRMFKANIIKWLHGPDHLNFFLSAASYSCRNHSVCGVCFSARLLALFSLQDIISS